MARWLLLVAVVSGCGRELAGPADSKPAQLTVREALSSGARTAKLGEDCRAGGASDCRTDHCVHAGLAPRDVYVCTIGCDVDDDCPTDWRCLEEVPGMNWCAPPVLNPAWSPGPISPRTPRSRPVPAGVMLPVGPRFDGGAP
jgi:hypothetical protein